MGWSKGGGGKIRPVKDDKLLWPYAKILAFIISIFSFLQTIIAMPVARRVWGPSLLSTSIIGREQVKPQTREVVLDFLVCMCHIP